MATFTGRAARSIAAVCAGAALTAGLSTVSAQAVEPTREACYHDAGTRMSGLWVVPDVDLSEGDTGVCVRELQEDLRASGMVSGPDAPTFVDGVFGPKTLAAVLKLQNTYPTQTGGPDGIVGIKTWGLLISSTTD
ncbi:peptidoglycan-binding domain-containing protein [Streptomyces sp. NPDC054933]|jgi:zinc D-Ala-D-Ala carboxypeptidase